jgi:hypothetical protein
MAEDFLKKYYPQALSTPMALPAERIAKEMELAIQSVRLAENLSLFGMIAFGDCTVVCYDDD